MKDKIICAAIWYKDLKSEYKDFDFSFVSKMTRKLSLMTSLFIVSIIFFIVYFWDYKLF